MNNKKKKEGGRCRVQRGRSEPGKVGLLWREMAIYVAENGVWRWGGGVGEGARVFFLSLTFS